MRGKAFQKSIDGGWLGEYARPSDSELGQALGETLQHYRMLQRRWLDEPSRSDVRETLRRLARMTQAEAAERWADLDACTTVEIDLQLYLQHVEIHGKGAPYRKGMKHIKEGPENIPDIAKHALDRLEEGISKGGRRETAHLSVELAAYLAAHWWRLNGTAPTVRIANYDGTDFQVWAKAMFERAGYATGDIYKHLQDGVRAAKEDGRIPVK